MAVEGELVLAGVTTCTRPGECGCGRGFPGLTSHGATTTALVTDLPHVSVAELREAVRGHLERGWLDLVEAGLPDDDPDPEGAVEEVMTELVDEHVEHIMRICESHVCGTVVHRTGPVVTARALPAAA